MNNVLNPQALKRWGIFGLASFLIGYAVIAGGLVWSYFYWPSLVIGSCFLGGVFIWRFKKSAAGLPRTGLEIGIGVYLVALLASLVNSPNPKAGFDFLALILTYLTIFIVLVDLFDVGLEQKPIVAALVVVIGLLNLVTVFEIYSWYQSWWLEIGTFWAAPPVTYRFVSIIRHPNMMMGLVNVVAPLTICLWQFTKRPIYRVLLIYWWITYVLIIPWSSSRGGLIGVATWVMVFLALLAWEYSFSNIINTYWSRRTFIQRIWLLLVIFGILISIVWLFIFQNRHPSHGGHLFGSRVWIWDFAISIWKSNLWLGAGPGRFGFEFAKLATIPPFFWAFYAHSTPIQVLAELGIAGLAALSVFLFFLVRKLIKLYLSSIGQRRILMRAAIAGLASFAVHSLVDDFTQSPAVMLPVIVILAVACSSSPEKHTAYWHRSAWIFPGVIFSLVLGYLCWNAWVYQPLADAIRISQNGNWDDAASLAETHWSRNPDSAFANIEAGLAYGRLWEQTGNPEDLDRARNYFRTALTQEPVFSVYFADLAILDWQAGDEDGALWAVQRAAALAYQEPSIKLLEGWILEQVGENNAAKKAYERTLQLEPDWVTHTFWEESELRKAVQREYLQQVSVSPSSWEPVWQAYAKGDLDAAQHMLLLNKWRGYRELDYWVLSGLIAEARGEKELAMDYYEQLAAEIRQRQWIVNTGYYRDVNIGAYRREGFHFDLVPGYFQLEIDVGQVDALTRLLDWYTINGDLHNAAYISELMDTMLETDTRK
jgi:tetratricopeptide (TPR) repeat protein